MKAKDELINLLDNLDRKARKNINEYTMTEIQKISEKAKFLIEDCNPESEYINELNKSIKFSDKFHKELSYENIDNIMIVLRSTKFAIESFLYKEFGIDI